MMRPVAAQVRVPARVLARMLVGKVGLWVPAEGAARTDERSHSRTRATGAPPPRSLPTLPISSRWEWDKKTLPHFPSFFGYQICSVLRPALGIMLSEFLGIPNNFSLYLENES